MRSGLVLELGEGVARLVLEGDFASDVDTLHSMEMHMALCEPVTRFKRGWARMVAVEADPACWEVLARWAYAQGRIPVGTRRSEQSRVRRLKALADKITTEVVRLANHPAYRNMAVVGDSMEILPAYRMVLQDTSTFMGPTPSSVMTLSDYADAPLDRGHLEPATVMVRGRRYTEWNWVSVPD